MVLCCDLLWASDRLHRFVLDGRASNARRLRCAGVLYFEWSPTPEEALATMFELNNCYALDGRDPNSSTGNCWVLGRYDRRYRPERSIVGKVRYMSSEATAHKHAVGDYVRCSAP